MIQKNVNLQSFNTFQIPAIAQSYLAFADEEELFELVDNEQLWPVTSPEDVANVFVLGGGSNILLPDRLNKLVIHPQNSGIVVSPLDRGMITVGAGADWDKLVAYTVRQHLTGLECLTLIPGNVGASVVQNIGAYGAEVSDVVQQVRCLNLVTKEVEVLSNQDCQFDYRSSVFKSRPELLVLEVTFKLEVVPFFFRYIPSLLDLPKLLVLAFKSLRFDTSSWKGRFKPRMHFDKVRQLLAVESFPIRLKRALVKFIRTKTMPDPTLVANVGCFFKSPILSKTAFQKLQLRLQGVATYPHTDESLKVSAGDLIKLVGLNGHQQGNVKIESNRPLIIISNGQATGHEISQFATFVQNTVLKETGIRIEPEVVIVDAGAVDKTQSKKANDDSVDELKEVEALFKAKHEQSEQSSHHLDGEQSA